MASELILPIPSWEPLLVPAAGAAVIVLLAAAACRLNRAALWQRTVWQVSTLGLLGLLVLHITGGGRAAVQVCRLAADETASPVLPDPGLALPASARATDRLPAAMDPVADDADFSWDFTSNLAVGAAIASLPRGRQWDLVRSGVLQDGLASATPAASPDPRNCTEFCALGVSSCAKGDSSIFVDTKIGTAPGPRMGLPFGMREPGGESRNSGQFSGEPMPTRPASVWRPAWVAGVVWVLGSVLLLMRIAWTQVALAAFRRRLVAAHDRRLCLRVQVLARRLGIRRAVRVMHAESLPAPVSFGVLWPTIVLPADFPGPFNAAQQDAVLAHELGHLAAGDPVWHLLASTASALLWWQPAAWWSQGRLRAASEAAADETSLLVPGGPAALAACLVTLGRRLAQPERMGWLSVEGGGFRSSLARRVQRLLNLGTRSWENPGPGRLLATRSLLAGLSVAAALSCTAWAQPQVPLAEGGSTMNVVSSAWRSSLAAAALWALAGPAPVPATAAEEAAEKPKAVAPDRPEGDKPAAREREEGDKPAAREKGEKEDGRREARKEERREKPDRDVRREDGEKPDRDLRREERRERPDRDVRREDRRESPEREARDQPRREGEGREMIERRRHDVEEQIENVKRQIAALRPDQDAEAQELKTRLERLQGQFRELSGAAVRPDREHLQQRIEELKRRIQQLREEGSHDEADRLMREGRELMQRIERGPEGGPRPERPLGYEDRGERERRLQHLKTAADNLEAAGFADQAENLRRVIERIARGEAGPPPFSRQPGPERPDGRAPHHPEMNPAVQQLRGEVQEMRREMQELREHLKALLQREDQRKER